MCLSKVTKEFTPPTLKEQVAWKAVYIIDSPIRGIRFKLPYFSSTPIRMDKWISADQVKVWTMAGDAYFSGFHCFIALEDALKSDLDYDALIKVIVRRVRLLGHQDGSRVLVADEMFIPTPAPYELNKADLVQLEHLSQAGDYVVSSKASIKALNNLVCLGYARISKWEGRGKQRDPAKWEITRRGIDFITKRQKQN